VNKIGLGSCPFAGFVVITFEHSSSATRELVNCKAGYMVIGYEDGRWMELTAVIVSCIRDAELVPVTGCGEVG
jgi:hypothetical protein